MNKIYRYKDSDGNLVKSIYPKPTEDIEIIANGIISLGVIVVALIVILNL